MTLFSPLQCKGSELGGGFENCPWISVGRVIMNTYTLSFSLSQTVLLLDRLTGIHLFVEMLRIRAMKLRESDRDLQTAHFKGECGVSALVQDARDLRRP